MYLRKQNSVSEGALRDSARKALGGNLWDAEKVSTEGLY
jgi:hypothetical protein